MTLRRTAIAMSLLVGLATVACGDDDDDGDAAGQDQQQIVFWTIEDVAERVTATQAIVDDFTAESGIEVELVAIGEDQLQAQVTSAAAAGELPDVFGALSLGLTHSLAADEIADPEAAAEVIENLGRDTFSPRALELVDEDGTPVGVPSDAWTALLLYRTDLFEQAGLAPPETFDAIMEAATQLNGDGTAGIVAPTAAGDAFTQQIFEYVALANDCQVVDDEGEVTLTSPECVEAFRFYTDLIHDGSLSGAQDVDTTRATYFAGDAAMIFWSTFILDELAGLRDDALPTCPECQADPRFLADNSGIVTAIEGPDGEPTQFGEVVSFVISFDAATEPAQRFVEYMMSDGYTDWLAIAPEGKFPTRLGDTENPNAYTEAWAQLDVGVDRHEPLSEIFSPETVDVLAQATDTMSRWGFLQGQGQLVGPLLVELPVADALAAAIDGSSDPEQAAERAQTEVEEIRDAVD